MRYRALSPSGDYTFGSGSSTFLINSPATVAQAILTSLLLFRGEWFLDVTVGVPYSTQILGKQPTQDTGNPDTRASYDVAIRTAILGVQGVQSIDAYNSQLIKRMLMVDATVTTIYGMVFISTTFGPNAPQPQVVVTPSGATITGPGGEIITN